MENNKTTKQQKILTFFKSNNSKTKNTDNIETSQNTNATNSEEITTKTIDYAVCPPETKKVKRNPTRKYDKGYLKFGFTILPGSEQCPQPLCVVCLEKLSNDAMKPSKLNRHLQSKHSDLVDKPLDFFIRLQGQLKIQKNQMKEMTISEKSLLKASYLVAFRISKTKKPFSIGEELVKPCMLDVAREVLGFEAAKKLEAVPISNDTIQRRINDMAFDIEEQVIDGIKKSRYFAIQLDESTDISNHAILLCFVRYTKIEDFSEELLCCLDLPGRTTSSEIFSALNGYIQTYGLDWSKCVGVCSDGAASMTGYRSGVVSKIKAVADSEMLFTHCIIHREQLVAKRLSAELSVVMNDVIKIVNEIRSRALNSRLFATLCDSMDSQHQHLLLHTEIRWLSKGKVLTRFVELREEIKIFLIERNSILAKVLDDDEWVAKLAYMANMFGFLNDLNISLQGVSSNIFTLRNKIDGFKRKLSYWRCKIQDENIDMFPLLEEVLEGIDVNRKCLLKIIDEHLRGLTQNFDRYYPDDEDPRKGNLWIHDPFIENINSCSLNNQEKEMLIDLSSDVTLVSRYKTKTLCQFWISLQEEYPALSYKAIKLLSAFSTTYSCEKAFSTMAILKTKQRNRLELSASLRLAETMLTPRFPMIIANEQQQKSH